MEEEYFFENSCSNVNACSLLKENGFDDSICKGWCEQFSWDGKTFPSKPEYFTKNQLRRVVETEGVVSEETLYSIKCECWSYMEEVSQLLLDHKEVTLPTLLFESFNKLKKFTDDGQESPLEWVEIYAEIRSGIRNFLKILEKIDNSGV